MAIDPTLKAQPNNLHQQNYANAASDLNTNMKSVANSIVGFILTSVKSAKDTAASLFTGVAGKASQPPELEAPAKLSAEDMILALISIKNQLSDTRAAMSLNDIKANMAEQSRLGDKRIAEFNKSTEKIAESSKAGTWKKVFGWIGAVVAVATAVVLIATGVGAGLGALVLASAVLSFGMMIAQEIPEVAQWLKDHPTVGYIIAGVQIALAIATLGVAGFGGLANAANTVSTFASKLPSLLAGLSGFISMLQGGAQIYTAIVQYGADTAKANATEISAEMLAVQALIEDEIKRLRKMLEELQEGFSVAMEMLNQSSEANLAIIRRQAV